MISRSQENLLFTDEQTGEQVRVHYYSFCVLTKGIMVKYGNCSEREAEERIWKSSDISAPEDFLGAVYLSHELEYHWAMLLAYGDSYWLREPPVSVDPPSDYGDWERKYIEQHRLAPERYTYL